MGEPVLGEFARFRPAKLRAAALLKTLESIDEAQSDVIIKSAL